MRVRIRRLILLLLGGVAAVRLAAQTRAARPAIVVLNLRFDGEHATVLEPGDTAVARAATSRLRATLRASGGLAVVDSSAVADALAAVAADGNPCDSACARAVARPLHAAWVAGAGARPPARSEEHTSQLQPPYDLACRPLPGKTNTRPSAQRSSIRPTPT